jgi:hypothetical protein
MKEMSLRCGARKVLLLATLAAATPFASAATRLTVALDGSSVTVDNISTMPEATVRSLVLAADRSTQDGCPFDRAKKGLIKSGDRVVISDHYIAWLDMTPADGIAFDPPFSNKYSRSGELAGYWSLNPATQTFRFMGQADGQHCWNWARNELIPGSASPTGQRLLWDKYGPPTEHTIAVVTAHHPTNEKEDTKILFAHNYSQMAANGQWKRVVDGQVNADGSIYYKTSGRMATGTGQVDISDGIDSNGVAAHIASEVEYFFRPTDILNAWRFSASRTTEANNVYMLYWVAHANGQDMDSTDCDVDPEGVDKWPSASYTTAWFTQSSVPLIATFDTNGKPKGTQFPPGTAVKMVNGATCSNPHYNQDINSWKYQDRNANVVVDGTWMRVGESLSTPANSKRFLTYVHQMPNVNGNGTKASPFDFKFNRMLSWNETHDGTLGFGVASGPYEKRADYTILTGGTWYYTLHALSSAY